MLGEQEEVIHQELEVLQEQVVLDVPQGFLEDQVLEVLQVMMELVVYQVM